MIWARNVDRPISINQKKMLNDLTMTGNLTDLAMTANALQSPCNLPAIALQSPCNLPVSPLHATYTCRNVQQIDLYYAFQVIFPKDPKQG